MYKTEGSNMYSINYEIKPIFYADEQMCKDFARLELLCDEKRGHKHNDWYKSGCEDYYILGEQDKYRYNFVAFYDKEIIGFASGNLDYDMYLASLYVNPEYHGLGIGTKLLETTEQAVSIIASNLMLFPLSTAVSFYQQYKYNYMAGNTKTMVKKLPKNVTGVVPVFEWCDELQAKLNVKMNTDVLRNNKRQPKFVYVGKDNKIDGVAILLPDGEKLIKLNDKQKSVAKYRKLELDWALESCR